MAFGKNLIFFFLFLLTACAQVGVLTGGDEDIVAPRPILEKNSPPNESKNFTGNNVEMTFDEFIQLNNPSQTMVMLPGNNKPKASVHKKTLKIEWEDTLEENTTYVIYLNGTVRDVTENNDSLMTYAFTTGANLDSLKYRVKVVDAWTNQLLTNTLVGLFKDSVSDKPYYYAKSNKQGIASFSYLKQGSYFSRAFVDENNDFTIQPSEAQAFRSGVLVLDSSITDTLPLRISKPAEKNKIRTFKFLAPGSFIVGANYSLKNARFILNNVQLDSSSIQIHSEDSVQLFADVKSISEVQLIVKTEFQSDTSSLRIIEKEKLAKIIIQPSFNAKQIGPHEDLSFKVHDKITTIDTSKINILNSLDSTHITDFEVVFSVNLFCVVFERKEFEEIQLIFQKGAIQTLNAKENDSSAISIQLKEEKDYGIINLNVTAFSGQVIVELLQNNKLVSRMIAPESKICRFENLIPGEYQFRVMEDINNNGKWDPGNWNLKKQAEDVFIFSEPVKVRANWEIDLIYAP